MRFLLLLLALLVPTAVFAEIDPLAFLKEENPVPKAAPVAEKKDPSLMEAVQAEKGGIAESEFSRFLLDEKENPVNALHNAELEKALPVLEENYRKLAAEREKKIDEIIEKQGKPAQPDEATDLPALMEVSDKSVMGEEIVSGKEEKKVDPTEKPRVIKVRSLEYEAVNDAASNPENKGIEYFIFTTALDKQKWRASRADPNISPFIEKHVKLTVLPSAAPAATLAYVVNYLSDTGRREKAVALLDYAYEYGRNVIPLSKLDRWLINHGVEPTEKMDIKADALKKRFVHLVDLFAKPGNLDFSWEQRLEANWHDGLVFVDGVFDPELFMRVYGLANPEEAKNFFEPGERTKPKEPSVKPEETKQVEIQKPEKQALPTLSEEKKPAVLEEKAAELVVLKPGASSSESVLPEEKEVEPAVLEEKSPETVEKPSEALPEAAPSAEKPLEVSPESGSSAEMPVPLAVEEEDNGKK